MSRPFQPALDQIVQRVRERQRATRARRTDWSSYESVADLCDDHFRLRSSEDHINRESMTYALSLLEGRPARIVETGVSCRGTDSTRLLDSYVRSFGGTFESADIDPEVVGNVQNDLGERSEVVCEDSVSFLDRLARDDSREAVDFVYLDSYDVDFSDPMPAALHCLDEFRAIAPKLRKGSIVLIDDSPGNDELIPVEIRAAALDAARRHGSLPGKGMLVEQELAPLGVMRASSGYQALYVFEDPSVLSEFRASD